jgi:hypothetical protein
MKRFCALLLTVGLLFTVSGSVLAAIHHKEDIDNFFGLNEMARTDTWYYVEKDKPVVDLGYFKYHDADISTYGLNYYQDDQTFIVFDNLNVGGYPGIQLKGSFSTDFGLFVGFQRLTGSAFPDSHTWYSPGFRMRVGEGGYAAFSVNYDGENNQIEEYDADVLILSEKSKLAGEILVPRESGSSTLDLKYVSRVSDDVAFGLSFWGLGNQNEFSLGATFTGVENLVVDAKLTPETDGTSYHLSGMLKAGESLSLGAQYDKLVADTGVTTFKLKYSMEDAMFVFKYQMTEPSTFLLAYEMQL